MQPPNPAENARRARVILMLAEGESYSTIEEAIPWYRDYSNRWRRRFMAQRDGLRPRYRGPAPTELTSAMEARILAKARDAPPDGSTHWSTRKGRARERSVRDSAGRHAGCPSPALDGRQLIDTLSPAIATRPTAGRMKG